MDAEQDRLRAVGVPIVAPLVSEAFGQRHFIAGGPGGVPVHVITPVSPKPEFAAQLAPEAAAR